MDLGLAGKIALVAASSRGIGRATATALAREGARVAMCARDPDALEAAADRICQDTGADVFTFAVDLSEPGGPERFVAQAADAAGGLDILVTNTGGPDAGGFGDLADDAWRAGWDQVLMSAVRSIRAATPLMERRGAGRVINVTSLAAKQPISGRVLSNAYRAAVVSMAKTLSTELAPKNILVNNVCPGRIATGRTHVQDAARAERAGTAVEQVRMHRQREIPLGRYGTADEVAALITFLASQHASYITGSTIVCDGGLHTGVM